MLFEKWEPTPMFLPGESRDGGDWWAAVYGVAQSQTRLKRLSSSSSRLNSFQEECMEEKAMGKQLPDHCGQKIEGFQNL